MSRSKQRQQLQQLEHGPPSSPSSSFSEVWREEAGEDEVEMVVGVVVALPGWSD